MYAQARWTGGSSATLRDDRGHEVIIDLPKDEGGGDLGTSALELNLLSLTGCVVTIFTLVARKRRVPFSSLEVDAVPERPKGAPTITRVHGTCRVASTAAREDVEAVLGITLRTCPVGVLYEQAGVPVEIDLVLSEPHGHGAPVEHLPVPVE